MVWPPATSLSFTNLQKILPFPQIFFGLKAWAMTFISIVFTARNVLPTDFPPIAHLSFPLSLSSHTILSVRPLKHIFQIAAPSRSPNALHPQALLYFLIVFVTLWYLIYLCFFVSFNWLLYSLLLDVSSLIKGALSAVHTLRWSPLPRKMAYKRQSINICE